MSGERILLTGGDGQLGAYVLERLHLRGSTSVLATRRGGVWEILTRAPGEPERVPFELTDASTIHAAVAKARPDVVIHLAAPSYVAHTWSYPAATFDEIATSTIHLLEALRHHAPRARLLCASSSDVFARSRVSPQSSATPFAPANPYGIAKAAAAEAVRAYRAHFGLAAANAFFYLLESPARSLRFAAPKIADAAAAIALGQAASVSLGDLDATRDWLFAGDAADALIALIDHGATTDVVVGSGQARTVRDVAAAAFAHAGVHDWQARVSVDAALVRPPTGGAVMVADVAETTRTIGWAPRTTFDELMRILVDAALTRRKRDTTV